jgi:hypothetical protein
VVRPKPIDRIEVADLLRRKVWEFVPESDDRDETWVRPVSKLPVQSLSGCVAAIEVTLANGQPIPALIGNFDVDAPELSEHFLSLSLCTDGHTWFHLARYHDVDAATRGPSALARSLKLRLKDVFPIAFDLTGLVAGSPVKLRGAVNTKPSRRLSRAEIISLALR